MDASTRQTTKDERSGATSSITARKLKKRELDRKAQRMARERTRNRINELESLVEQLKADSLNPEVSNLTATLDRVTQQRNELQNVIKSIEQTVQRCVRQQETPDAAHRQVVGEDDSDRLDDLGKPQFANEDGSVNVPGHQSAGDLWQHILPATFSSSVPLDLPHQTPNPQLATESWVLPGPPSHEQQEQHQPQHHHPSCAQSDEIIVPRPEWPCDCIQSNASNTWRDANTALGKSTMLSPTQLVIEDFTSEDTPIRVVLDGWDSVVKAGKMSLSWRKLRQIDEACFATCGAVERLGILRTMHLLITYHGDPSQERCEKVPRWLWARPSQMLPHSYAIDFFVWPGLRERFIFAQHRYCTNIFWNLFRHSIRLNIPLDLEDCYQVDDDTGRYVFSPGFDSYLRGINTWRMKTDFFAEFPELVGDIPVFESIGASMPWSRAERVCYARIAEQTAAKSIAAAQSSSELQGDDDGLDALVPTSGAYEAADMGETGPLSIGAVCSWPCV
ncbi:hypothetical protein CC79DRAFT_1357587 [Sarocladium strictum]